MIWKTSRDSTRFPTKDGSWPFGLTAIRMLLVISVRFVHDVAVSEPLLWSAWTAQSRAC